jgi:excinuclease UvrABC ATPase subunit
MDHWIISVAASLWEARTGSSGLRRPQGGGHSPSLTRDYLTGRKSIPIPKSRRKWSSSIKILCARQHNLKNIDVELPLGVFTCVTGVSGSGKSTLIHDVLYPKFAARKGQSSDQEAGTCKSIHGTHRIGDVVMVDQSPLARTPRSTPILYLGLFDQVRELFAAQPEAMRKDSPQPRFRLIPAMGVANVARARVTKNRDAILERSLRPLRRMRRQTFPVARSQGAIP